MSEGNSSTDAGMPDSEHFSPYRADGKLVGFFSSTVSFFLLLRNGKGIRQRSKNNNKKVKTLLVQKDILQRGKKGREHH